MPSQGIAFDKNQTLKAKGVAICLLLFHHLFYTSSRVTAGGVVFHLFSKETVMAVASGCRVCVWMFVFLSAYGLTKRYEKMVSSGASEGPEGAGETAREKTGIQGSYYRRYYLSLMKPYWFIFAVVMILSLFLFKRPWEIFEGSWVKAFLSFFALSDLFGTPMPISVWWYMTLAQLVVLLVPFFHEAIRRFSGPAVLAVSFVAMQYFNSGVGIISTFGGPYLNYLFVLILGVWFARENIMERLGKKSPRWYVRLAEVLLLLAAAVGFMWINAEYVNGDKWRYTKLLVSLAAVSVTLLSYKYLTQKHVEKVLVFLGRYSATIFMIHGFAYAYYLPLVYWSHNVVVTFLTLLLASLLVSILLEKLRSVLTGFAGGLLKKGRG